MRSLAFSTLLGGIVACTGLTGQSLTEHAAAAAGATIGTAAGKPLGTSLGKIFGDVDKSTSAATTIKNAKPAPAAIKPSSAPAKSETAAATGSQHAAVPAAAAAGGGGNAPQGGGGGGSNANPSHRSSHPRDAAAEAPAPVPAAALVPVIPAVAEPVIRQIRPEDVAKIEVGASGSDMRATLGQPASTVTIPGDGGHLLEICQYWANGGPVGTVRLDNGRVVSVKTSN